MNYTLDSIKLFSDKMREHHFLLTYKGNVSHEIVIAVLALAEKKMDIDGTVLPIKKKVFNVLIECLQNISYHAEVQNNSRDGLIMIGRNGNAFIVYSSNLVANENVEELKGKIETINAATKEQLTQMYRDLISAPHHSEKGTAGLGLIDIAKKSGSKIEYLFSPFDEKRSYFVMSTNISINSNEYQAT
jgi:hypothetical protein